MKRATDAQFDELHNLLTTEFLARIKSGEATNENVWQRPLGEEYDKYTLSVFLSF